MTSQFAVTSRYDRSNSRERERGILCEPDSREPLFISAAHDDGCLAETLEKFENALEVTLANGGGQE